LVARHRPSSGVLDGLHDGIHIGDGLIRNQLGDFLIRDRISRHNSGHEAAVVARDHVRPPLTLRLRELPAEGFTVELAHRRKVVGRGRAR